MYYVVETEKTFDQASEALEAAIKQHGFGLQYVHNLGETLRNKGSAFDEQCKIFEVCNPELATQVLAIDLCLNMALPCRISVFTEHGTTKIGFIRPGLILSALSDNPELARIAHIVEERSTLMIEEAR
jgi:uncharacterized protein (DUF302 family)